MRREGVIIRPVYRALARVGIVLLILITAYCFNLVVSNTINDYVTEIIKQCGIAIILAVSLNIVNGLTGQFSIGHAGFMSVGAYTGASITYWVEMAYFHGQNQNLGLQWLLVAMLGGGIAAGICGYLVGVPSLRLRGDYLAIVTLGFGEIIRVLIENSAEISPSLKFLGGAVGFVGASGYYQVPLISNVFIIYATAAFVILLCWNLKFTAHGLAFMAIREDEVAAEAMGIPTTYTKVIAFVLSSFFAGVGGALYAHAEFFQPITFNFILSMNYVIMVVLGGSGSITGTTLAAIFLVVLPEFLKPVQHRFGLPDAYRVVIYALLLILTMLLRPQGAFGMGELSLKPLVERLKSRRGRTPTSSSVQQTTSVSWAQDQEVGNAVAEREGVRPTEQVLVVENLSKKFAGLSALSEVNLYLRKGELVGLIGPNGAGKTTVFNILTGVYEPTEGHILFCGKTIAGKRPTPFAPHLVRALRDTLFGGAGGWILGTILATSILPSSHRNVHTLEVEHVLEWIITLSFAAYAFIVSWRANRYLPGLQPHQMAELGISRTFQNIRLFANLSVLDNVRLGAYLRRSTNLFDALFRSERLQKEEQESVRKARELLNRFNLLRFEKELACNLPYGDQRRLEIVRALATQPKLLLLDEPAAGMNPQEKMQLMELIRRIREEFELTVLLIEHDMKLVMGICERIYVLDYGRIIAEGKPEEIRNNPEVIAAYLGEEHLSKPTADDSWNRVSIQDAEEAL
ncbi:ABC-type branched-chain amino acid transport systems, ATPase component [Chthonomonas calidirosea]|uniref:ABC-type branched-chain amino acid transport systems, ATPase component n=1 Tax=Chthonomonas calidirosea (strain DSM 23976 / ICMP 18418 / T49) TaxID=1303518 RepID=S0ET67_CHTCT|nr:ATP-binding cassette domain-containing protein [Chthonomonas calidirosea]CCW34255.1 ABC-type branched-chain amino acid transport systems, ATPase component [Chthonomonas calidirosea T49]CEK15307.1 ABC-type branched-chain amino acid transport systems, ATPase component [Chthonomonas calidirosea]